MRDARPAVSREASTEALEVRRAIVLQPTNSVWYSLPALASDGSHAHGVAERSGQWLAHFFCFKTGDEIVRETVEVGVQDPSARPEHSEVEARVARVAEPIASGMGLTLVKVRYQGTRTHGALRLTIDKPGGVTLDDCTRLSRAVGHALDVEEPIDHRYALEVSSPGLDRPLENRRDFEQAVGRLVRVKTSQSWDGPRLLIGRVLGQDAAGVRVEEREGSREWSVPWEAIAHARLEVEW